MISDVDAASYYPNIIMNAGLIPELGGNKGEAFLNAYREIYEARIKAKRKMQELAREIRALEKEINELK
jgi:hypothetical protein